jgi:hypothetical protein
MPRTDQIMRIIRLEGVLTLLIRIVGYFHEHVVRPYLPTKEDNLAKFNGVYVSYEKTKYLDAILGLVNYEGPLVRELKDCAAHANCIIIVGGGYGVSTTKAAKYSDEDTEIISYEGSETMFQRLLCTLSINNVSGVNTKKKIVGDPISVASDTVTDESISPSELPASDLLILDCEGTEKQILNQMTHQPSTIIVETHGQYGSPVEDINEILLRKGYSLKNETVMSINKDMSILTFKIA